VADDADAVDAEQHRAAGRLRSTFAAYGKSAGINTSPALLVSGVEADRRHQDAHEDVQRSLEALLAPRAGEAVRDDDVRLAVREVAALERCR